MSERPQEDFTRGGKHAAVGHGDLTHRKTGDSSASPNYQTWIAAHLPVDPRGQCVEMTLKMAEAFPELRRVRGHYICPVAGRRSHWWMVTPAGEIVDPTAEQFVSNGIGDYEEYTGAEPTGQCLNCGKLLFGSDSFCNEDCFKQIKAFMERGGAIFVNGFEVTGAQP